MKSRRFSAAKQEHLLLKSYPKDLENGVLAIALSVLQAMHSEHLNKYERTLLLEASVRLGEKGDKKRRAKTGRSR